jgi:ATP:ADP antiporter, AAA family
MSQSTAQFGKVRSFFWPVHNYELKKLIPMLLMFFCISFNYTILRDTKDTLIVTAPGSGAEAIPFLKVWGVVPVAVVFMLIFAKLSNVLSKEKLFYATLAPFLIFFALFPTLIYPYRDALHPTALADSLQSILPAGLMGLVAMFRNWTYAAFYILSELWGSVVLSLLFWSFANEITRVSEAKRFYTLFGLGANFALLFSGPAIVFVSDIRSKLPADVDAWGVSLNYLMTMVVIAGLVTMATYRWMTKNILTDARFYDASEVKTTKKKEKPKMSLKESFLFLAKSPYIGFLALIVLSYGVAINLVEVTWKGQLKLQFPNANEYSAFMGKFSFFTGLVTIVMLLLGGPIIRRFGWGKAAALTPIILALTGGGFFCFVLFRDSLTGFIAMMGSTPLMLAVLFGAAQNIMSKSTKYSLFDPTKEMAYIPLDQESKVKGKAAIDVVGARLGKSGGSLIQQGLLVVFGSLAMITPYVAVIMLVIIVGWLLSVRALSGRFATATAAKEAELAAKAPAVGATATPATN